MQDSPHRLPLAASRPDPSSTREHRRLRRARRGDDAAFAQLVESHDEVLRSLAARLVGTGNMDDTLLTAYVKAYRALPRLGDGTTVHAWLYRATYMAALDVLRREWRRTNRSRRRHVRAGGTHPSLIRQDPFAVLDDLPADQRAVLVLMDRHRLAPGEVAAMLDVHPRQVATLLHRARVAYEAATGPPLPVRTTAGTTPAAGAGTAGAPAPVGTAPVGTGTGQPGAAEAEPEARPASQESEPETPAPPPVDHPDRLTEANTHAAEASPTEARPTDSGAAGSGVADSGAAEARPEDAGVADSRAEDAGVADSRAEDAGVADSRAEDAGAADSRAEDAGVADSRAEDAGVADSRAEDAGVPDSGAAEARPEDAGAADSDAAEARSTEARPAETGVADSGAAEPGLVAAGPPFAPGGADAVSGPLHPRNPLLDLPVPEHRPRFWHELGTQLIAERAAPAMPPPAMGPAAPKGDATGPAPSDEPVDLERLVRRADRGRHRRRWSSTVKQRGAIAVAVLGTAAIIGVALKIGGSAEPPLERQGPVAQTVASRVSDRLAGLVALRATVDVRRVVDGRTERASWAVVLDDDGSFRLTSNDTDHVVTYDAATDTRRERRVTPGPTGPVVTAKETTGFAAGPPDASPVDLDLVTGDVRAGLRAVRSTERHLATGAEAAGAPVWELEAGLPAPTPDGVDRIRLSVDRAELLPVEVLASRDGVPLRLTTFRDVVPNEPAPPDTFALAFAEGDPVERTDGGFRPVMLAEVARTIGFEPLRPGYLPDGFTLAATQVRTEGKVVSLRYRRGFEQVVVSTRPSPVGVGERWSDPFYRDGPVASEPVTLSAGALLGDPAEIAVAIPGGPQLWGSNGLLAVTVAGDVTPDELTRIAESLR